MGSIVLTYVGVKIGLNCQDVIEAIPKNNKDMVDKSLISVYDMNHKR